MMTLSGERLARERVISDIQLKKLDDSDLFAAPSLTGAFYGTSIRAAHVIHLQQASSKDSCADLFIFATTQRWNIFHWSWHPPNGPRLQQRQAPADFTHGWGLSF
jgi:hypothetical protein